MGTIRAEQTRLLQENGTENIEFQVYDKDGNKKSNFLQTKNVLTQVPSNITPLNQDLQVEYLRPLRDAIKTTITNQSQLLNKNPNFRYKTFDWDITASQVSVQIPSQILAGINPISGIYCLYQDQIPLIPEKTTHMIKNILGTTPIQSGRDIEISWNYFIFTGIGTSKTSQFISVGLDSTNDGTVNKMYNFETNKFETGTFTQDEYFQKIDYTQMDSWNKYKTIIKANLTASETNPRIEVKLFRMTGNANTAFFGKVLYDGFEISQKSSFTKRVHIRRRGNTFKLIDGAITEEQDNVTGEYEQKPTILSNELEELDLSAIQGGGVFTRKNLPLSILTNTLDKNILQEKINDFRDPVKRYEGTFYKDDADTTPIYFYNKIWINFGTTVLQEPVAAIIDGLEYDVKQNEYRIIMHLPNQDDDKVSFDLYKFE